jgi:hypothetical protein
MVVIRVTELQQQQQQEAQLNRFFTSGMMENKPLIVSYVFGS